MEDKALLDLFHAETNGVDMCDPQFYNTVEQMDELFGTYVRFASSSQFMHFINHDLPDILGTQSTVNCGLGSRLI